MRRRENHKNQENIVILNLALDTRSSLGKAEKKAYVLFSQLGKLRNAKLFHLIELVEKMNKATNAKLSDDFLAITTQQEVDAYLVMNDEQKYEFEKKKFEEEARRSLILDNMNILTINPQWKELKLPEKNIFIKNIFKQLVDDNLIPLLDELSKEDKSRYDALDLPEQIAFLNKVCLEKYKSQYRDEYINQLQQKANFTPHELTQEEKADLALYHEVQEAISNSTEIIVLAHCNKELDYLSSDSHIWISDERLISLFPMNMKNKYVNLIVCEADKFSARFVNSLLTKAKNDSTFHCEGMVLSSRKYTTIPLPHGGKFYIKMRKNGLPKIFSTDKEYRTDILIKKDDYILYPISNNKNKIEFKMIVADYHKERQEKRKIAKKLRRLEYVEKNKVEKTQFKPAQNSSLFQKELKENRPPQEEKREKPSIKRRWTR